VGLFAPVHFDMAGRAGGGITWRAEQAIRNYGPCISCVTHFLKVRVTLEE
jgi:coenzyme F420-reducing hydrogenase alpha subunit